MPTSHTPRRVFLAAGLAVAALAGIALNPGGFAAPALAQSTTSDKSAAQPGANEAVAIFAGGCFWCVESDFDHVPGVLRTVSGYSGGHRDNPTYKQVTYEDTGHREVVQVTFDPSKVSYAALLDVFWRSVDPTDAGGQFCDRGFSYTTAIYATSVEQLAAAAASKEALEKAGTLKTPIATEIAAAGPFWPAEGYHQDYYQKSSVRYRYYRWSCGRDARVKELWGDEAHKGIEKAES